MLIKDDAQRNGYAVASYTGSRVQNEKMNLSIGYRDRHTALTWLNAKCIVQYILCMGGE